MKILEDKVLYNHEYHLDMLKIRNLLNCKKAVKIRAQLKIRIYNHITSANS